MILQGKIMKNITGVWIVSQNEADKDIDDISFCWDGPKVVDFRLKKLWWCSRDRR